MANRSILLEKGADERELERWMIMGGIQSLWTYHKDLSFFELLSLVVNFRSPESYAPEKITNKIFMDKLYERLKEARERANNE